MLLGSSLTSLEVELSKQHPDVKFAPLQLSWIKGNKQKGVIFLFPSLPLLSVADRSSPSSQFSSSSKNISLFIQLLERCGRFLSRYSLFALQHLLATCCCPLVALFWNCKSRYILWSKGVLSYWMTSCQESLTDLTSSKVSREILSSFFHWIM